MRKTSYWLLFLGIILLSSIPFARTGSFVFRREKNPLVYQYKYKSSAQPEYNITLTTDTQKLTETVESTATVKPPDFDRFVRKQQFFVYSQDNWNKMRQSKEEGWFLKEKVAVSTAPAAPMPLLIPGKVGIDMGETATLSISGQKTIGTNFSYTHYFTPSEENRTRNTSNVTMSQSLAVQIRGKIGNKVNVDVDYNDQVGNKQDIRVSYQGEPGEVVQDAAFGDVTLDLPSTTFVGYSKQVFGARAKAKYKSLDLMVIGSRSKGTPQAKVFTGNVSFEKKEIQDISYIKRKYYQLAFPGDIVKPGSEQIYVDDKNVRTDTQNTKTLGFEDYYVATTTGEGRFDLLYPGQDYTVDYNKGVIVFRRELGENYVLIVDYQREDNNYLHSYSSGTYTGSKLYKLLKTSNDAPLSNATEIGYRRELKNYYSLGRTKIVRNNGRGNFILYVTDTNRNKPAQIEGGKPVPQYPYDVSVDFETGIFYFNSPNPFSDSTYVGGTSRISKYLIYVEFQYRIRERNLPPNIVPQSERIVMDGKPLVRDVDYFLDYESGFLSLYPQVEDKITENTRLEITYEQAPFAGIGSGETVVGARAQWSVTPKIFVGSTVLYQGTPSAGKVPDVRSAPQDKQVYEVDARWNDLKLPLLGTVSVSGEIAKSAANPNTMGKAMVDSMEGIKQVDSVGTYKANWCPSANYDSGEKTQLVTPFLGKEDDKGVIITKGILNNEDVYMKDINPLYSSELLSTEEKRQALVINYDLVKSTEISIVQTISNVGIDYSKKQFLETWIYGDGNGAELFIRYGGVNEDADGDKILDTEDINNDGILNPGEDIGYPYTNPDGSIVYIGENNSRIDSEDLDGDGMLDSDNGTGSTFGVNSVNFNTYGVLVDTNGVAHSSIDWTGWRMFTTQLNITDLDEPNWTTIRQVRITVKGGGSLRGQIKIGYLGLVGNKWEEGVTYGVVGSTLTVGAVNNEENIIYFDKTLITNNQYRELYRDELETNKWRKEQALTLNYILGPGSTGTTRTIFKPIQDFSQYGQLNFFLYPYKRGDNDEFFIQIGASDSDCFEYRIPLNWSDRWEVFHLPIPTDAKPNPPGWIRKGSPKLKNIAQIRLGIQNLATSSGAVSTGELWVNEIYLDEVQKKEGIAWRSDLKWNVPGWFSAGGALQYIEPDFQTLTAFISNQKKKDRSIFFNFNKLNFMPNTGFELGWNTSETESTLENAFISSLSQGKTETVMAKGRTSLVIPYLPHLGVEYTKKSDYFGSVNQVREDESYSGNLNYDNPLGLKNFDILPTKYVMFRPFPTRINVTYGESLNSTLENPRTDIPEEDFTSRLLRKEKDGFDRLSSRATRKNWNGNTNFVFWEGFNLDPNYSRKEEYQLDISTTATQVLYENPYPTVFEQSLGLNSTVKIFSWLSPNMKLSLSSRENTNVTLPQKNLKSLNRTSSANVSWNFPVGTFLPKIALFKTLNLSSAFDFTGSDNYENIPSTFTIKDKIDQLWVSKEKTIEDRSKQMTNFSQTQRVSLSNSTWKPLELVKFPKLISRLSPFNTLSMVANYSKQLQETITTGTPQKNTSQTWPNLTFQMNDLEKMVFLEKFVSNIGFNLGITETSTEQENVSQDLRNNLNNNLNFRVSKYSISINYSEENKENRKYDPQNKEYLRNTRDFGAKVGSGISFDLSPWRFSPRCDIESRYTYEYTSREDTGTLKTDLLTVNTALQSTADINLPKGIEIPFTKSVIDLKNRLVFNSSVNYTGKFSIKQQADNNHTIGFNATVDYTVSDNVRVQFGTNGSVYIHQFQSKENRLQAGGSASVVIQF